ncbi:MAG: T9SS type A sorting domain-containing protein [Ignavibacteria bacterium]|nr:T9SS type A sorting domain-containing protein [Ignavibacteria bacterium]
MRTLDYAGLLRTDFRRSTEFPRSIILFCALLTFTLVSQVFSYAGATQGSKSYVSFKHTPGAFPLSVAGTSAPLCVSSKDFPGILRVVKHLQTDIRNVTGAEPDLLIDEIPQSKSIVLVGTLGKNSFIDELVRAKKLSIKNIAGRWEAFLIQTIEKPFPGIDRALVIVGSDKRGTMYGMYDLSAQIGVSPWYFWADVPVRKRSTLYVLSGSHTLGEPSVKYRGLFINDEQPALGGWAYEKFGGFNSRFYEHVFELILRMKGNFLWPAMWGRAFYVDDPRNPILADEYGVVIGTSHHEPMMRAHAEWAQIGTGPWNYERNEKVLQDYWRESIKRTGSLESVITLGMRGDGDEPMTEEANIALLQRIVRDQREILAEVTGKDITTIPQVWALYKEVQEYYDRGMRTPDDVTLLLCDDNWGNIRKLPKLNEKPHPGGYGIYYHYDYVGGPRNYKWLNTNQISRVWEQMHLAYRYGATRIWIVNVGDINNDGHFDLILTGLSADNWNGAGAFVNIVVLYGKGDGTFTYKWNAINYIDSGLPQVNNIRAWDVGDFNNDGLPDLFGSVTFGPRRMWRNNGDGTFTEVSTPIYMSSDGGRAGGFVDYNNDGFLDVYTHQGTSSTLQRNNGNSNHWIAFTPVGIGNNKSAIGARFTLYTQGGTAKQTRVIKAEGNAGGGQALVANFGIGINTSIDSVAVWWPDGTRMTYTGLAVDRYWTVIQGSENPSAPTLTAPANAATGVAQTGTLTWSAGAGATSYRVQVSLDQTFGNDKLLAVNATATGTSYAFSLGAATKYYWRVAAINGGFMSPYSAVSNFTTAGAAAVTVPALSSPADAATDQPASLTLRIGKTADASRYQWQISVLSTFATLYASESTADTTLTVQVVGGQKYFWRVRGVNDLGATAYSAARSFTVMLHPARATLLAPSNNAVNVIADSVTFAWSRVSNAASYNLQVTTLASTNTYSTTDTTYKVYNLTRGTNHTWKVEAINAGGTSFYTSSFAFTTVPAVPAAPGLLTPASAAANVGRMARFVWNASVNATKYRLQVSVDNAFATVLRDTVVIDTIAVLSSPLASNTDYFWRVRAENLGGAGVYSTARTFTTGTALPVEKVAEEIPREFALHQNYPNPFNPSTTIRYDVPASARVTLQIHDLLGRVVATLVDEHQSPGQYTVRWDPIGLSGGTYFLRIDVQNLDGAGRFSSVKKLLYLK